MEEEGAFTITATTTYTVKDMVYDDGWTSDHKCIGCEGFFKRRYIGTITVKKTIGDTVIDVDDETKLCLCKNCYITHGGESAQWAKYHF
jgi:hypothetical protein